MFDHAYFVGWFGRLLVALNEHGVGNAIIVMDNAKYHKCIPATTPRLSWKKADLIDVCDLLAILHAPGELKASIWEKLQPYTSSVVPVVVDMAASAGYEASGPSSKVKLVVRLDRAFEGLTSAMVHGCINKAERDLLELHKHICTIDNDEYDESDGSDDDCGSGDESSSDEDSDRSAFDDAFLG
ncbi:hypothetical protein DYB26_003072 [Aphanomyces astaci]|uniref:Uncharacterized protein n=1 Tax=Aphanomyces astaci TaxID=112090 RepID=A0A397ATT7_APHAT|nr:hypothetical protein DYB36_013987 [Aphanomyces astaci]RHZ11410.1 hypothetical protein DYB26_003072 [Aphanomyces astaci]